MGAGDCSMCHCDFSGIQEVECASHLLYTVTVWHLLTITMPNCHCGCQHNDMQGVSAEACLGSGRKQAEALVSA